MAGPTLLIIDDETRLRGLLARILSLEGYRVLEAPDARTAQSLLETEPVQVVVSDVRLPDAHGVALTKQLKTKFPDLEIVVLTAYGTITDGVEAMRNGAFDYLTKGDENDRIVPTVARAVEKAALQRRVRQLERNVAPLPDFDGMIGSAPAFLATVNLARRVAPLDTTVLLLGETGTGKEVFAQALHAASPRKAGSFVAINCGALERDILESELFGHRAGAFTGATRDKKGLFTEADHGTLFLDEVGEMPLELQVKLLRVLETGEFLRVGDTKPTRVDVRLLAATNRELSAEVEAGRFRADLYYRLSVFTITLPPLRERPGDIPALAEAFRSQFAAKMNPKVRSLHPDFLQGLQSHPWRGNVRELRNVLERAVILANGETLTADLLPFSSNPFTISPDDVSLSAVEQAHIRRVLAQTGGNKTETARLLGIGLTTLYAKIKEYGL